MTLALDFKEKAVVVPEGTTIADFLYYMEKHVKDWSNWKILYTKASNSTITRYNLDEYGTIDNTNHTWPKSGD